MDLPGKRIVGLRLPDQVDEPNVEMAPLFDSTAPSNDLPGLGTTAEPEPESSSSDTSTSIESYKSESPIDAVQSNVFYSAEELFELLEFAEPQSMYFTAHLTAHHSSASLQEVY